MSIQEGTMSIRDRIFNEYNQLCEEWKQIIKSNDRFIDYLISVYSQDPYIKPTIENVFNPFKFTVPHKISLIIAANTSHINSCGLAFSSSILLDIHKNLSKEINDEYKFYSIADATFNKEFDKSMVSLAKQNVFMPILNIFPEHYMAGFSIELFWEGIFNELNKYACMTYLVLDSSVEPFVNKFVKTERSEEDKMKPNTPLNQYINAKVKMFMTGANPKGLGGIMKCNSYIKQFYKEPINWTLLFK